MIMLAMLLQAAAPQSGGPVYLKCVLTDKDGESHIDVQLNEVESQVTYSFTLGEFYRSYTSRALFASDRVMFNGFSINRADLTFERDNRDNEAYKLIGLPAGETWINRGKCQISNDKRSF